MQKPLRTSLPTAPGVYLFKDAFGRILYIGKAKNLRSRVLSYFRARGVSTKTRAMLSHAETVATLSTTTENEAFLLEAGLIKKHKPRYNIVLRDDKDYIFFRLNTAEPYPRLEIFRRFRPGQKTASLLVFGPFSSTKAARETWKVIHQAFPLRRCSAKAFRNRVRPCLYHHMGQCPAPCCLEVPRETYQELVRQTALFLSGGSAELLDALRGEMLAAADRLDFEHAAMLRDRAAAVERTVERQSVLLPHSLDMDVLGVSACDAPAQGLALGVIFVRQGVLLDKRAFFWPGLCLDDAPELIESFLAQFYQDGMPVPPRIIAPWLGGGAAYLTGARRNRQGDSATLLKNMLKTLRGGAVRLNGPENSDEDRLVSMAAANAVDAARAEDQNPLSARLAAKFHTHAPVMRIEAADVSHTSGAGARVGMVVFENGRPLRSGYRTYAVDAGNDDYAALRAWALRRAASGPPWPDILLVDGGRGQVACVARVFEEVCGKAPCILAGIAKARTEDGKADRRAGNTDDRIYLAGRSNPLPLRSGSPELLFLQHVRDTAHAYALGRHRMARSREAFAGELLRIPDVGPKTAQLLWKTFGSLQSIAEADAARLAAIPGIGARRALILARRLRELAGTSIRTMR